MNQYKEVIDFSLNVNKWNIVEEVGMPNEYEFCFIVYRGKTNIEFFSWSVGGYNPNNHEFYCNMGLGGMVVDADSVVAWKLIDDVDFKRTIEYPWDKYVDDTLYD